jgi:hypothetical protein
MQSHFNKLEKHIKRNLDRFSRNLQHSMEKDVDIRKEFTERSSDFKLPIEKSTLVKKKKTKATVYVDSEPNINVNINNIAKSEDLRLKNQVKKSNHIPPRPRVRAKERNKLVCELCGKEQKTWELKYHMNQHYGKLHSYNFRV